MYEPITIFCAFTRDWAVPLWLDNLKHVEHNPKRVNLCFIIDIDDQQMYDRLEQYGKAKGYRKVVIKMNRDHQPNEMRIAMRRERIAGIHNQSKWLVAQTDGEYVIGLEDDTVFDRLKSFEQLIEPMRRNSHLGFVEGVQMGRWGANMIGAWQANDLWRPTAVQTILPTNGDFFDYDYITGGGWYGYATRRDLYLSCDYYTSTTQPWGPDVNYGFWLNQQGIDCIVDWTVLFGHNDHGTIGYPDNPPRGKLTEVVYTRDKINWQWGRSDVDKQKDFY